MMYNMHLIINTHWDREYRWSFAETQFRLAEAVDDLIDIMKSDEKFAYFHTDSQTSMLDDYLEIRPERKDELKELVRKGRILTGPWYTLPAEFLVSGEALIRNLLMGHQIAENLGKVMKAAYNIFSWGQVSQLPQIYKQFGMNTIIFYRGIDQSSLDTLEFIWKAPDGTEALGLTFGSFHRLNFWKYVYLPYIIGNNGASGNNYCVSRDNLGKDGFLFNLCDGISDDINHHVVNQPCARDISAALDGMKKLVASVSDKSSVNELLFLQGFDQENPDPIVSELVDEINRNIDYGVLKVSSLPEYMEIVREELEAGKKLENLPVREGEMLEVEKVGDAFGPLYNGVFSARMPLKVMNSSCQYLLEYYAEPLASMNMLVNKTYPALPLGNAWKELLKNQQHDGIGGCHVDRVTKTMVERYDTVRDIAETITRDSIKDMTCKIDFSRLKEKEIGLAVFNPTQFNRSEVITVYIDIPKDWNCAYVDAHSKREFSLKITDISGREVRTQILAMEDDTVFGYLKFGNVIGFDAIRVYLAIELENVPPMGYSTYVITPSRKIQRPKQSLSPEGNVLENEYLRAKICGNGTISLTDRKTGKVYDNLHYFEDAGDKGGPLIYKELFEKGIYNTLSLSPSISMVYNGPLLSKYRISHEWQLPEALDADVKVHVPHGSEWIEKGRVKRSDKKKNVGISTEVILRKGSHRLEFITDVDNTVCDHRLRVLFPTGLSDAKYCMADSPFDVVSRPIDIPDSTGWYEEAARTFPSQSLVSVKREDEQFTVIHRGLPEYEITDNKSRTVCMTLLRCISTAGNPTETYRYQELAQCLGKHTFNYSLHVGEAPGMDAAGLLAEAVTCNVPLRAAQTTYHKGEYDVQNSFFQVSSSKFIITAVKKAEKEDGLVIRGYNASEKEIHISIKFGIPIKYAKKVTLEELELDRLMVFEEKTISAAVGRKEIASFLVKIGDSSL